MKYLGGKSKIAKYIAPIINRYRRVDDVYIELFCGGCNITEFVSGPRIAVDSNFYVIEMWKALQRGWIPPKHITKEEYADIRDSKDNYPPWIVGYVGINASFQGKWFGGYAGRTKTVDGRYRYYTKEAYNNVMKQILKLTDVNFVHSDYKDIEISNNSLVYCDPPYVGREEYHEKFDTEVFWDWAINLSLRDVLIFVSEITAPDDFVPVWSNYRLTTTGLLGGNLIQECLFVHRRFT